MVPRFKERPCNEVLCITSSFFGPVIVKYVGNSDRAKSRCNENDLPVNLPFVISFTKKRN